MTVDLDYHKITTTIVSGALVAGFVWWLNAREAINTIPDLKARIVELENDRQSYARMDEAMKYIKERVDEVYKAVVNP